MLSINESDPYLQNHTSSYGWRAFIIECLVGLALMIWFILLMAEKVALKGVKQLQEVECMFGRSAGGRR